jgi:hypothetical protein
MIDHMAELSQFDRRSHELTIAKFRVRHFMKQAKCVVNKVTNAQRNDMHLQSYFKRLCLGYQRIHEHDSRI